MRYSLREQKEGGRKEKNNAFLILMWDVFCLEGADALKCTHCDSWKKKKKDETLSVKLWEEREEYFSEYFLKLNK